MTRLPRRGADHPPHEQARDHHNRRRASCDRLGRVAWASGAQPLPFGERSLRRDGGGVNWLAMSCRSLLLSAVAVAVAVTSTGLFVGCGRREPPTPQKTVEMEVHFTSIEGSVAVKRAGTLQWIDATLAVALRNNDLVRGPPCSCLSLPWFLVRWRL